MSKSLCIIWILINCCLSSGAQILLKKTALEKHQSFIKQYLNLKVLLSYSIYFLVIIMNMYILRYIPLIILNMFAETLPYVLSIFTGKLFFQEKITRKKVLGLLFILLGIIVVLIV